MNKTDQQRCQKNFEACLGRVAANLVAGKSDPYTLTGFQIESNGGVRKKTLRLLSEAGHIGYYRSGQWRRASEEDSKATFHFRRQFEEHAEDIAEEPVFEEIPTEVTSALSTSRNHGNISSGHDELGAVGFRNIFGNGLTAREKIYVWLHRDDFVVQEQEDKYRYQNSEPGKIWAVYPKAMLDQRKLHTVRALFKKYAEPMLMPWLAEKFALQLVGFDNHTKHNDPIVTEGYFAEDDPTLKLRSAIRFPRLFQAKYFERDLHGYSFEYAARLGWLRLKTQTMRDLTAKVAEYGYETLMTEFVEFAKAEVLTEAPVLMAEGSEAGAGMAILDSIHLVTYDNMFGRNSEQKRHSETY